MKKGLTRIDNDAIVLILIAFGFGFLDVAIILKELGVI